MRVGVSPATSKRPFGQTIFNTQPKNAAVFLSSPYSFIALRIDLEILEVNISLTDFRRNDTNCLRMILAFSISKRTLMIE